MATELSHSKGRDRLLSTLNTLIQILDVAKVACVVPPAQAAFGSASVLLAMIRVHSLLLYRYQSLVHVHSGLHGQ